MEKIQEPPLMEERLYRLTEGLKPETLILTIKKEDYSFPILLILAKNQGFEDVDEKSIFSVRADYEVERFCEYNIRGTVVDFVPRFICQFTYGIGTRNLETTSTFAEALLRVVSGAVERVSFDIDPVEIILFASLNKDRKFVNEITYYRFVDEP